MDIQRLRIGFVGSGFITRFHIQSLLGVRDAEAAGVWSPNAVNARAAAALARQLDVGAARAFPSLEAMVADDAIDAIWLCGPNHRRLDNMAAITAGAARRSRPLRGIACEKPLARNVAEARQMAALARKLGVPTGYLEDQLFAPATEAGRALAWGRGAAATGRPYLARAAEEHSGPHRPWFWMGALQGGGVMNDMMCHSALLVRHLLTRPGEPLSTVRPKRLAAHVASLKWSQPLYARRLARTMGREVDYRKNPSEDFASLHVEFETADKTTVIGECSVSWSYVGAGLRLSAELLGPEYSMSWNSLDTGLKLFFSREVQGKAGEDLVEKQNAETGLMPVVVGEAAVYGYEAENRHFARAFLHGTPPALSFADGVGVVELLMAAYKSAESGRTLNFPPPGLATYVPACARTAPR
ncbi:MAG TPA: Gfo/Idh/MocA family oxidoreductase [Terriglobales bacterium]|jgi:predicted dehydrogenase